MFWVGACSFWSEGTIFGLNEIVARKFIKPFQSKDLSLHRTCLPTNEMLMVLGLRNLSRVSAITFWCWTVKMKPNLWMILLRVKSSDFSGTYIGALSRQSKSEAEELILFWAALRVEHLLWVWPSIKTTDPLFTWGLSWTEYVTAVSRKVTEMGCVLGTGFVNNNNCYSD